MSNSNTPQNTMESLLSVLRDDYIADLPTRLQEMENQVLSLEDNQKFEEQYQALFRHVHSIKGSAGTHGLFILSRICHRFEDHLTAKKQSTALNRQQVAHLLLFVDLLVSARNKIIEGFDIFTVIEHKLEELEEQVFKDVVKVLIVGQSSSVIRLISEVLTEYPVQISTSSDGLHSLDKLVHDKFDLMFIGMELPMLNGFSVIAATRMSKAINSSLPIILLTSNVDIKVDESLAVNYVIQRDASLIANIEKAFKKIIKT